MTESISEVWTNTCIATMDGSEPFGLIAGGAIALRNEKILWVGKHSELPPPFDRWPEKDLQGRLLTPGLIDCHTHLVHGGNRAREFEMRLTGSSYAQIAREGGGIMATVRATRAESVENLFKSALPRLDALIAEGVTTVEIKSGYGLDFETETTMLRAARALGSLRPISVLTSFLGAHAVPEDYRRDPDRYIDEVCLPALDSANANGLVDAVDGFCETIAFTPDQIKRVLARARQHGLPVKLHADQLSDLGGAELAAGFGALSADHLEYTNEAGVCAMAESGTVATLLPGAYYMLRETRMPPVDLFRSHGVPIAVATDSNPGSSPITSLLTVMNMACTLFRLTPEEALAGVTRNAALALGLHDRGIIREGCRADLAVWDVDHPRELSSRIGPNPLIKRTFSGDT